MAKRLQITLSEEATAKYLNISKKLTEAEVNADCEPSGASLNIEIGGPVYGNNVSINGAYIGETDVDLILDE